MAVTATGTRPWQHLNLKISADTATGDRTVTSLDGTKTYSTSSGQTGTWSNPSTDMLNDYNNAQRARGLPQVTSADFNRIWQTQGTDIPNQVAASYLNDIEKNKRKAPKQIIIKKISKILKVNLDDLNDLAGKS